MSGLQISADSSGILTITLPNSQTIVINNLTSYGITPSHPNYHNYPDTIVNKIGYTQNYSGSNYLHSINFYQQTTLENAFMALRHLPAPELEFLNSGAAVTQNTISYVPGFGEVMLERAAPAAPRKPAVNQTV